ncbi:hypothetical protein [Coleofasciculus sp. G1-WW12-02]|uniref:hypothetical protein n=1 Tax=unclassified Coleofasciculus TaxID=2692782 RepID=UPI0032F969E9
MTLPKGIALGELTPLILALNVGTGESVLSRFWHNLSPQDRVCHRGYRRQFRLGRWVGVGRVHAEFGAEFVVRSPEKL